MLHECLVRPPARGVQSYDAPVRIVVLPGDGIGPACVEATIEVLDATGIDVTWEFHDVGQRAFDACGDALPAEVLEAVRACGVALKGPVATPVGAPFRSVNVALRRALDLYAQVRPVRSPPGEVAAHRDVDLAVLRETTEDLYRGVEVMPATPDADHLLAWLAERGELLPPSTGFSLKPVSAEASRRAVQLAFNYAARTGRTRVTLVHKASVMRATDAVFLREGLALAEAHPHLVVDSLAVDAAAAALVREPQALQLLVTTNLYGDVLSDVAAALVGGLGLAPGVNYGDDVAVFEAAHGTAPRSAGKDRANPFALILTGALLLEHVGEVEAATRVRAAVDAVLRDGTDLTADLRGPADERPAAGTRQAAQAVLARL
jgi:isocitrate dehydrogenase (NAD+)